MQQLSAMAREWTAQVFQDTRSSVEKLLDCHLTDDIHGMNTTILHEFSSRTFNPVDIERILCRIWKIVEELQVYPNLLRKALTLLHHCLLHGSKHVATKCLKRPKFSTLTRTLSNAYTRREYERHQYNGDLDFGAGCHKISLLVSELLHNPKILQAERFKVQTMHSELAARGLGSPRHSLSIVMPYSDNSNEFMDVSFDTWELGGKGHVKYDPDDDLNPLSN